MRNMLTKLQQIEKNLSASKGNFELFALFLREESLDRWDLLVSAPWIEKNEQIELNEIIKKLQEVFNQDEMIQLSMVVPIERNNESLEDIHRAVNVEHGLIELKNCNFFGMSIKHAYIFTSKKN